MAWVPDYAPTPVASNPLPEPSKPDLEKLKDEARIAYQQPTDHIRNKIRRKERVEILQRKKKRYQRAERDKNKKLREKLGDEAPPTKVPHTLENTRIKGETTVQPNDQEVLADEACDSLGQCFSSGDLPKTMITTSPNPPKRLREFITELLTVFPYSSYHSRRRGFSVQEICQSAIKHGFTDVLIFHADKKLINGVLHCHLPYGPTASYKLSKLVLAKDILGHGKPTRHTPELILNNFNTRLAHDVGRMFAALFPKQPNFGGRRVVTLHNQRDFLFFRHHRYIFESAEKARLQECGPRFVLKMRYLQPGPFDPINGEFDFYYKPNELGQGKRDFFLF